MWMTPALTVVPVVGWRRIPSTELANTAACLRSHQVTRRRLPPIAPWWLARLRRSVPRVCNQGCDEPDIDTDHDSVLDCADECLLSAVKASPGACGCDSPDDDSDGDGDFKRERVCDDNSDIDDGRRRGQRTATTTTTKRTTTKRTTTTPMMVATRAAADDDDDDDDELQDGTDKAENSNRLVQWVSGWRQNK